jgi:hypothetical protein
MTDSPAFLDAVTAWLRDHQPDARATAVTSQGLDMNGDTDGGFYASFEVTVEFALSDGSTSYMRVEGSDMAELWNAVVSKFPTT